MDAALAALVSIAFHGLAYAMVLYLIAVGLSVTTRLIGFVNLAHGIFAMAGGYVAVSLMSHAGVPFFAAVAAAFVAVGLVSTVLERALYARLYAAGELDQVLMTIGLVFMAAAAAKYFFGPLPLPVRLPS